MTDKPTLLLEHHLKELKLPSFLREYGKMAAQCAAEGADHPQYLLRLAELELIDRHQRMVERRIRAARFPAVKSLDTFDFLAIPPVNKVLVAELARCEYAQRRENVIAVGNSGTGNVGLRRSSHNHHSGVDFPLLGHGSIFKSAKHLFSRFRLGSCNKPIAKAEHRSG